jgi:hypothetical protein
MRRAREPEITKAMASSSQEYATTNNKNDLRGWYAVSAQRWTFPKGINKPDTSDGNDDWTPNKTFPRMPTCAILSTTHRQDCGAEGSGWSRNQIPEILRSKSITR